MMIYQNILLRELRRESLVTLKGLQQEGVIACGKHFPGMRLTKEDTHFKADEHPGDINRLMDVELKPFRKAIEEGVDAIMMHHGKYPAIDAVRPASMSIPWHNILRRELNFEGLIVSDDLII
jgi:beta-N-acetylhexosaminidase